MPSIGIHTLSVDLGAGALTEFRLFKVGENRTANGTYLFDEQSAQSVMAAYTEHGVDCMIDLEHLSLGGRITWATRWDGARSNCETESCGRLNVKWTAAGQKRLTERSQRYVSPAFDVDADGKVLRMINIALTALPATYATQALIAAHVEIGRMVRAAPPVATSMEPVVLAVCEPVKEAAVAVPPVEDVAVAVVAPEGKAMDAAQIAADHESAWEWIPRSCRKSSPLLA